MLKILLSPDPADPAAPADAPAAPTPPPASPDVSPPGKATAAATVLAGKTEREAQLEAELAAAQKAHADTNQQRIERERRISELEDQLHQLKNLTPTPAPKPAKKKSEWGFFTD